MGETPPPPFGEKFSVFYDEISMDWMRYPLLAKYPKIPSLFYDKGKVQKKRKNKLTSVSFMYVCVAGNG